MPRMRPLETANAFFLTLSSAEAATQDEAVRVCSSFRRKPESICFAFAFDFLIDSLQ